jgi:hypothetical protein
MKQSQKMILFSSGEVGEVDWSNARSIYLEEENATGKGSGG